MPDQLSQQFFAGIDIGSTMSKAVIVDGEGAICAYVVGQTGAEHRLRANKVMAEVLQKAHASLDEVGYIISTGYGRVNVPFADKQVTELTCHTKGVCSLFPEAKTIIDIGGQDAKVLKVVNGRLTDFLLNDKCAAGTGRFLEVAAETLGLTVSEMGSISLTADDPVSINSLCTIFAQQEIIARLSEGQPLPNILAGVFIAVTTRVVKLAKQLGIQQPVVFTGGVAKNTGMVKAMETVLGMPVLIAEEPLITGALGAAILARDQALQLAQAGQYQVKQRKLSEARIEFAEKNK